jgi:hypothetical protein
MIRRAKQRRREGVVWAKVPIPADVWDDLMRQGPDAEERIIKALRRVAKERPRKRR